MKGHYSLKVLFDYQEEEDLNRISEYFANLLGTVDFKAIVKDTKLENVRTNYGIDSKDYTPLNKENKMEPQETEGQKLYGKFNPTGNPLVEVIKEKCAELHDLYTTLETTGRITAAIKTAAQMDLLRSQMLAVKDIFTKDI